MKKKFTVTTKDGPLIVEATGWKISPPGVLLFYTEHYPGEGEIVEEYITAFGTGAWIRVA